MFRLPRVSRICRRTLLAAACLGLLVLGAPAGATAAPTISVNDVSHTEGNSGGTNASFTVTLSEASASVVTVAYATEDGTAGAPGDYASATGTVTFAPNQTSASVAVTVIGDTLDEPDETFKLKLSNSAGASIQDGEGTGTILDDDALPSLRVNDVSVTEGNSGTRNATFTVSLSRVSGRTVTVNFSTSNGSAVAGVDYNATAGTLTIPAGSTSRTVSVPVRGDTVDESDETFNLNLASSTNATVADGRGVGRIRDDDTTPRLSIRDAAWFEGNSGRRVRTFLVVLSSPTARTVTVRYATSQRTARSGSDYVGASGTVTINAGSTTATVPVTIIGDTADEANETFVVSLSRPSNASIADGSGVGTILDDEFPPRIRSLRISPNVFRAAGRGVPAPTGAQVSYRLSEQAFVFIHLRRARPGRMVNGRCVTPRRSNRGAPPCVRYVRLLGSRTSFRGAGLNSFHFTGRWRGRRLPPGRYRLVAQAVDATGLRSAPRHVHFRVVA